MAKLEKIERALPQQMAAGVSVAKEPFDIDAALARISAAIQPFPKAAMFELAEDGYGSVFEQLCACILSIRTLDEVSIQVARGLFAVARTPEELSRLSVAEIDRLIARSTFHEAKAAQLHEIASRTVRELGGELGCDEEVLLSFRGVGPKCANLVLGVACGRPCISVDIHVHRIVNRWGYVQATTPERTMVALGEKLPQRHWIDINRLLVPFGKHICRGALPKCSTCPVLAMCRQVGVSRHR
jgi:endonuclease III